MDIFQEMKDQEEIKLTDEIKPSLYYIWWRKCFLKWSKDI